MRISTILIATVSLGACDMSDPAIVTSIGGIDLPLDTRAATTVLNQSSDLSKRRYALQQLDAQAMGGDEQAARAALQTYSDADDPLFDLQGEVRMRERLLAAGDDRQRNPLVRLYLDEDSPAFDQDRARSLLRADFESGNDAAGRRLAAALSQQDADPDDLNDALSIYAELLARGDERSGLRLAGFLTNPDRNSFDPARGINVLTDLRRRGNGDAVARLGTLYARGIGVERDPEQAVIYFEEALTLGSDAGAVQFGLALLSGQGTQRDPERAIDLLEGAAANNMLIARIVLANRAPDRYATLVQTELTERGAYSGPLGQELTGPALAAFETWCLQNDIAQACAAGPLERDAVIAFSRSLR